MEVERAVTGWEALSGSISSADTAGKSRLMYDDMATRSCPAEIYCTNSFGIDRYISLKLVFDV